MLTQHGDVIDHPDRTAEPALSAVPPTHAGGHTPSSSTEDAVRYCHSLAVALNATAFSVLFCAHLTDTRRLIPLFDSTFPGVSELTDALSDLACRSIGLLASPTPAWWSPEREPTFLTAAARRWTREISSPLDGDSGIAFPVSIERGRSGVIVFSGDDMTIDEVALCETHARCHGLFAGVVRDLDAVAEVKPAMSKREIECLRLTANGLTSQQIAKALGLSVHTATQYLTNSTQKLNAVNRTHAVAKALRGGLID